MKKVLLKITMKSNSSLNSFNTIGIIDENVNILRYQEQDNTQVIFDLNNYILTRESEKILMKFKFNVNEITENEYLLKSINKSLKININTHKIYILKDYYSIEYSIIEDRFIYTVEFV